MSDEDYVRWKGERSPAAAGIWAAVRSRVRGDMTRGNFAIYFARSRGLVVQPAIAQDGPTLVVGAPNTSAAEGLETQFMRHVRRALDEQGARDLTVRVVLLPTRTLPNGEEVVDMDGDPTSDAPRDVPLVAAP